MNWLDLIIIVAAIGYAIGGYRNGAIVGLCSMAGFFGGAVLGAQLARPLASRLADGRAQVPIALVCVLALALLGQLLGVWLGTQLRQRVTWNPARNVDSAIGCALGIVAVPVVAWMVAVPLATSPFPELATAATHSSIVRGVDDVVPDDVRRLYSSMRSLLDQSGFPPVFGDLPSTPSVDVEAPTALTAQQTRAVQQVRGSVVKIYGQANSCNRGIEGSGFVYADDRVMTNAHVVAGTDRVSVQTHTGTTTARVVLYDPARDVAVLSVPGLDLTPLRFATGTAQTGDPAVVLGYPQDGPFNVQPARVSDATTISGTNIYGRDTVHRDIYTVRADVRSGNSGGPLIDDSGSVLGVIFAKSLDSASTGYALTAGEVASDAKAGRTATTAVGTGSCTPD